MGHKNNKAATAQAGESVQTDATPAHPQPFTAPDGTAFETASNSSGTDAMTTKSQSITAAPEQPENSFRVGMQIAGMTSIKLGDIPPNPRGGLWCAPTGGGHHMKQRNKRVAHKKYGKVKVLTRMATDRGGLARIETSTQGTFWVRAAEVGCAFGRERMGAPNEQR
jgi:hypothetical protein